MEESSEQLAPIIEKPPEQPKFSFKFDRLNRILWRGYITNAENVTFSLAFNSQGNPSEDWFLDIFKNNKKDFVIET